MHGASGSPPNSISLKEVEPEKCPSVKGRDRILDSFAAYLHDESRAEGLPPSALYFPESTAQVAGALEEARSRGESVVVSGSRTGVVGGAAGVEDAVIISLERMNARPGKRLLQAGVRLEEIGAGRERFPVDPTEMTASIGGAVATDASGARSYRYGSTRDHVKGLTVVLADGSLLEVDRGRVFSTGGAFTLGGPGGSIAVPVAGVGMPPVKNSAGLFLEEGMDLVDLFIGSEGTLGIMTEVSISTAVLPGKRLFLVIPAGEEEQALHLVDEIKSEARLECLAIEYFDRGSLALLRESGNLPPPLRDAECAVYLEVPADSEGCGKPLERAFAASGLSEDDAWAGLGEDDEGDMRRFRHLVPESVNSIIGRRRKGIPGLHKAGTDTAVPEGSLRELLSSSRRAIEEQGLEYVAFGHVGDNHIHVNMLPRSGEELLRAEALCFDIARESVRLGGTVSAEHGVGRLKKEYLRIQYSEEELDAMRAVKDALDPDGLLNPGVMF